MTRHATWEKRSWFIEMVCFGLDVVRASEHSGVCDQTGTRWWRDAGGMRLDQGRHLRGLADPPDWDSRGSGRSLSYADRRVIEFGLRHGHSYAVIGAGIGRDRSVVFREVQRNRSPDGRYYACAAHTMAHQRAKRPKQFKLREDRGLCARIEGWMDEGWSPKLIADVLAAQEPGDHTGRVSHETIYQCLYVQTRGHLRADLHRKLSTKRKQRQPRGKPKRNSSPFKEAFTISQRPAEVEDRAVPGHWEGDLIVGPGGKSAIGTLVERASRFTLLLHLPGRHTADEVAAAMINQMQGLPEHLRRSVTWDRGSELAAYERIQIALDLKLFFCDPHSPWQRGTNENTNRLLWFWFEKGSDLSVWDAKDLQHVQDTLNRRPRPTLDLQTPAQRFTSYLNTAA